MADDNEEPVQTPEPEEDPPEEGAPLWALTFGDMMSLLLCFFVLMFSMSEIKVDKFLIAAESLRNGLGHGSSNLKADAGMGGSSAVDSDVLMSDPAPYDITIAMDDIDDFMEFVADTLTDFVESQGVEGYVEVSKGDGGVSMNIQDVVLFNTGEAALRPQSRLLIAELGKIVAEFAMPVVVAGHTDDRPINTRVFPSNWELSAARAATVTRIILEQGLPPVNIHVEGYAEFRPDGTNDTSEGRARNRRVEVRYTRDAFISQMVAEQEQEIEALKREEAAREGNGSEGENLTDGETPTEVPSEAPPAVEDSLAPANQG